MVETKGGLGGGWGGRWVPASARIKKGVFHGGMVAGEGMGPRIREDTGEGWLVGEELDQDDYDGKDADDGAQAGEGARFGFGHLGAKGVDGFGGFDPVVSHFLAHLGTEGVDGFGGFDPVVFHFLAQISNVLSRVASEGGEFAAEMGYGVVEVSLGGELLGLAFGRRGWFFGGSHGGIIARGFDGREGEGSSEGSEVGGEGKRGMGLAWAGDAADGGREGDGRGGRLTLCWRRGYTLLVSFPHRVGPSRAKRRREAAADPTPQSAPVLPYI